MNVIAPRITSTNIAAATNRQQPSQSKQKFYGLFSDRVTFSGVVPKPAAPAFDIDQIVQVPEGTTVSPEFLAKVKRCASNVLRDFNPSLVKRLLNPKDPLKICPFSGNGHDLLPQSKTIWSPEQINLMTQQFQLIPRDALGVFISNLLPAPMLTRLLASNPLQTFLNADDSVAKLITAINIEEISRSPFTPSHHNVIYFPEKVELPQSLQGIVFDNYNTITDTDLERVIRHEFCHRCDFSKNLEIVPLGNHSHELSRDPEFLASVTRETETLFNSGKLKPEDKSLSGLPVAYYLPCRVNLQSYPVTQGVQVGEAFAEILAASQGGGVLEKDMVLAAYPKTLARIKELLEIS